MKAIKIFSALLAGLIICLFNIARVSAQSDESEAEPELVTDAKSAILIEPTTLAVIYEKNADDRRHPASMTKIMTMILIMEAVKKGVISFSDTLYASEYASSMGGTNIYLEPGEGMNAEDLFKSIAINSANDSAVVFAEAIGGSVNNFVRMMNNKAKEIGCTATTFKNPHGLPEAGHLSTARDMALMGAYLVNNHPEILKYTSIYEDYVREDTDKRFWLVNTNKLVRFVEGVDGIKTGWTNEAGYCLTATIKRDNKRFIAVVMGGSSAKVRNQEIMQMLNYALGTYEVHNIFKKDQVVATYEDVSLYPMRYNVVITTDVNVLLKKGEQLKDISVEKTIDYKNLPYDNKKVGTIKIYYDGELIKEVELAVQEEVRKASFIKVFWEVLKEILLVSK
ncbi:MAG TPA: D-alanyl-D-alanine carboxypeptidase [Acholeplasmataceae bacterium]|jgi:D-alanyl-D-alanine carboxypeptidase (penicillin-binding protein 5/6)|nr:D-alanyl-D-alanine carboxypeptidase [Acholeplasmataceae bacterium]